MGSITRNKGVHPDLSGILTEKDHIVLDWIEDTYTASFALSHDERKESEYQHIREMIKRDADDAFFTSIYERAFEDQHTANLPKSESYYMLTQDTDRELDADAESDLDITDKDLDPIYI